MEDFVKELDVFVTETYKAFWKNMDPNLNFINVELMINIPDEFKTKFNLNNDIDFSLTIISGGGRVNYRYKGVKIKPNGWWMREEGDKDVQVLDMLLLCIEKDTSYPDVRYLERPLITK